MYSDCSSGGVEATRKSAIISRWPVTEKRIGDRGRAVHRNLALRIFVLEYYQVAAARHSTPPPRRHRLRTFRLISTQCGQPYTEVLNWAEPHF